MSLANDGNMRNILSCRPRQNIFWRHHQPARGENKQKLCRQRKTNRTPRTHDNEASKQTFPKRFRARQSAYHATNLRRTPQHYDTPSITTYTKTKQIKSIWLLYSIYQEHRRLLRHRKMSFSANTPRGIRTAGRVRRRRFSAAPRRSP